MVTFKKILYFRNLPCAFIVSFYLFIDHGIANQKNIDEFGFIGEKVLLETLGTI